MKGSRNTLGIFLRLDFRSEAFLVFFFLSVYLFFFVILSLLVSLCVSAEVMPLFCSLLDVTGAKLSGSGGGDVLYVTREPGPRVGVRRIFRLH